jgi:hypothetical protein
VSDDVGKREEAAALYEGMVSAMQSARVGDHQVAALLLKLSEVRSARSAAPRVKVMQRSTCHFAQEARAHTA